MKISRRQLRKIIREEKNKLLERRTGNPALEAEERNLINAILEYADKWQLTMAGPTSNRSEDARRMKAVIIELIEGVIG